MTVTGFSLVCTKCKKDRNVSEYHWNSIKGLMANGFPVTLNCPKCLIPRHIIMATIGYPNGAEQAFFSKKKLQKRYLRGTGEKLGFMPEYRIRQLIESQGIKFA
jgi:hypothetical protein